MVQLLKHTAYRIWFAAIGSGAATMGVLALAGPSVNPAVSLPVLGAFFVFLLWLGGWLSDRVGLALIRPVMAEAGVWERSGMPEEADRRYAKAIALCDSFLLSPGARRRFLPGVVGRMARFYLALPEASDRADAFAAAYLARHPGDEALAATWLERLESSRGREDLPDALLARIGSALPRHRGIQEALFRLCLDRRRTDFAALEVYRRLMQIRGGCPPDAAPTLARLLLGEGRADEWALAVYLDAAAAEGPANELLGGLAACCRWLPETPRNRDRLEAARGYLEGVGPGARERMTAGFVPPVPTGPETATGAPEPDLGARMARWRRRSAGAMDAVGTRLRRTAALLASPAFRKGYRWTAVGIAAVAVAVLLVNTAGHLLPRSPAPTPPVEPTPPPAAPKPYTIQVAAYLKAEYADEYRDTLRGRGLDAYIVETRGGDKVWYQVRIAAFDTKKDAVDYGDSLKARGIVEDFYVANRSDAP